MALNLFPDDMKSKMVSNELSLESIAAKLTYFHEQLHLLHWQTTSYAHKLRHLMGEVLAKLR